MDTVRAAIRVLRVIDTARSAWWVLGLSEAPHHREVPSRTRRILTGTGLAAGGLVIGMALGVLIAQRSAQVAPRALDGSPGRR